MSILVIFLSMFTFDSSSAASVGVGVDGTITTGLGNTPKPYKYNICKDEDEDNCAMWAGMGECDKNPNYMHHNCRKSCQLCTPEIDFTEQKLGGSMEQQRLIAERIQTTNQYLQTILTNQTLSAIHHKCMNSLQHHYCTFWAAIGECEANPNYMNQKCAAVCHTCERLDISFRCPMSEATPDAWGPGDLNIFFTNLTSRTDLQEDLTILSQPPEGPWVVTLENFLSLEETEKLIYLGGIEGYKRSGGVGKVLSDGSVEDKVIEGRTSENAWCHHECMKDPMAVDIVNRIANLTYTPQEYSEHLQLLKYEVGQLYNAHHDFIETHIHRQPGPRILTVFLYLNEVEEGGGTNFPQLSLTVTPKPGMALIWPSVLDEDPNRRDARTIHSALPVEKGQKFAANAWVHLRDFKNPYDRTCH